MLCVIVKDTQFCMYKLILPGSTGNEGQMRSHIVNICRIVEGP